MSTGFVESMRAGIAPGAPENGGLPGLMEPPSARLLTKDGRVNLDLLRRYVADGWLVTRRHDAADYHLFDYTPRAQFRRHWDVVTTSCRGLIVDGQGTIIARPLPKFFNLDEHLTLYGALPAEPFEVTEKYDGSLGISYQLPDGTWAISTRGSFVSEQAQWATRFLRERGIDRTLQPGYTYLFEIVYPENRIVVRYTKPMLVLLAVIRLRDGGEMDPHNHGALGTSGCVLRVMYEGMSDLDTLRAQMASAGWENREGVVLRFIASNVRVKVKFEEYVRLHKLLTGITRHDIWARLAAQQALEPLYERVPDEFYAWVKAEAKGFQGEYERLHREAQATYRTILDNVGITMPFTRFEGETISASQFERLRAAMKHALSDSFKAHPRLEPALYALYQHERPARVRAMLWDLIEPARTVRGWRVDADADTAEAHEEEEQSDALR